MVVLVDKLLKTQVVECAAVANWIFSKEMVQDFTKLYVWEMLHLTVRKMNKHVNKLSKEASDMRKQIEDSDNSDNSDDSGDEDKMDTGRKNGGEKEKSDRAGQPKPTEEEVEKLEEKLEAAQADQKNLFLIIFQRFIMILSEHLVRCDTDGVDFKSSWYNWTIGRLQQIFLMVRITKTWT